ncbi:MAG: ABC transporter substrate-binding protein [Dehalococcoidia bacterium]
MPPRDFALLPTPGQIEDLTRRRLLVVMPTLVVLAASISCGDSDPQPTPATTTRTFTDDSGSQVEIPTRPERVIALSQLNVGVIMLELGAKPLGMIKNGGEWYSALTSVFDFTGIEAIGEFREPDLERIIALRPDLIIDACFVSNGTLVADHQPLHAQLRAIAPLVLFNAFGHPKDVYPKLGDLLGKEVQARVTELQQDYEERLTDLRSKFPGDIGDVTVGMFHFRGEEFLLPPLALTELIVLQDLGVRLSAPNVAATPLSLEQLNVIDADLLLFLNTTAARVQNLPTWQSHPAVKAGQFLELPPRPGNGYTRAFQTIDALEKLLLAPHFRSDLA